MRILFFSSLILFIPTDVLVAQNQGYIWPTDASHYLSSTFGETRAGHYHAGLDIKTWGREGYKVFASKDGKVNRLLITAHGYGRAVYLRHNDGNFTVYAHLQRFNDKLQSYIDSLRMRDYSFEIDASIDSLDFFVKQGDVIGYSGSTGIGPPHLHFEIRDSLQNPVNPLSMGLNVEDKIEPSFSALMILPLTKRASVQHSKFPTVIHPAQTEKGVYDFGTVRAAGEIGFAISISDKADNTTNKYAVYELLLMEDEDTLFHERLDTFSYGDQETMVLDRIPAFGTSGRSYHTLFKKDGSNIPFYLGKPMLKSLIPSGPLTTYSIIAKDYYGNSVKGTITINNDNDFSFLPINDTLLTLDEWYWTENWIATNTTSFLDLKNLNKGYPWQNSENQRLIYDDNVPVLFNRIYPSEKTKITSPDQNLNVILPQNAFFDTLSIAVSHSEYDGKPLISIRPEMLPVRKGYIIEYFLDDEIVSGHHYAFFRYNKKRNRLGFVDSELRGRILTGNPSELGDFLILTDDAPPVIFKPRLIKTSYQKYLIQIPVKDNLSGIDYTACEIIMNGIKGITEYDFEEGLLIYYNPSFKPLQINTAQITVADRVGNTETFLLKF